MQAVEAMQVAAFMAEQAVQVEALQAEHIMAEEGCTEDRSVLLLPRMQVVALNSLTMATLEAGLVTLRPDLVTLPGGTVTLPPDLATSPVGMAITSPVVMATTPATMNGITTSPVAVGADGGGVVTAGAAWEWVVIGQGMPDGV